MNHFHAVQREQKGYDPREDVLMCIGEVALIISLKKNDIYIGDIINAIMLKLKTEASVINADLYSRALEFLFLCNDEEFSKFERLYQPSLDIEHNQRMGF